MRDGIVKIVAVQTVDLARRDMRPVEQDFGLRDQRRVSVIRHFRRRVVDRCAERGRVRDRDRGGDAAKPQSTVMASVRIMR